MIINKKYDNIRGHLPHLVMWDHPLFGFKVTSISTSSSGVPSRRHLEQNLVSNKIFTLEPQTWQGGNETINYS